MSDFDLREAYLNGGYSRRGFARAADVPEQSVRRIEGGKGVTPANAKKIVDFLRDELEVEVRVTELVRPYGERAAA